MFNYGEIYENNYLKTNLSDDYLINFFKSWEIAINEKDILCFFKNYLDFFNKKENLKVLIKYDGTLHILKSLHYVKEDYTFVKLCIFNVNNNLLGTIFNSNDIKEYFLYLFENYPFWKEEKILLFIHLIYSIYNTNKQLIKHVDEVIMHVIYKIFNDKKCVYILRLIQLFLSQSIFLDIF